MDFEKIVDMLGVDGVAAMLEKVMENDEIRMVMEAEALSDCVGKVVKVLEEECLLNMMPPRYFSIIICTLISYYVDTYGEKFEIKNDVELAKDIFDAVRERRARKEGLC